MRNYLMIILCLNSILFTSSCSYKSLKPSAQQELTFQPAFHEAYKPILYRANMKFKDFEFGGLLAIRQMDNSVFRIALLSEVGIKLMDMELQPQKRILHQCNPKLNRPILLKVIENDFRLLFANDRKESKLKWLEAKDGQQILKIKGKKHRHYFMNDDVLQPIIIEKSNKFGKKKVIVSLEDYDANIPEKVLIEHQNIKLTLGLERVRK